MTVKFSRTSVTTTDTQPQPGSIEAKGLFSVLGSPKVSIYTEPADLTLTGYTVRIGYKFDDNRVGMALDNGRILYSKTDLLQSQVKSVAPTLLERQQEEGTYTEYRVPAGACSAYLWVSCTGGAINFQVGSV